eukprot:3941051-Rhodomonas_salina.4
MTGAGIASRDRTDIASRGVSSTAFALGGRGQSERSGKGEINCNSKVFCTSCTRTAIVGFDFAVYSDPCVLRHGWYWRRVCCYQTVCAVRYWRSVQVGDTGLCGTNAEYGGTRPMRTSTGQAAATLYSGTPMLYPFPSRGTGAAWVLAPEREGAHNWEGTGFQTAVRSVGALKQMAMATRFLCLSSYARHIACPVLTQRIMLPGHFGTFEWTVCGIWCYEKRGTDGTAYGATRLLVLTRTVLRSVVLTQRMVLPGLVRRTFARRPWRVDDGTSLLLPSCSGR